MTDFFLLFGPAIFMFLYLSFFTLVTLPRSFGRQKSFAWNLSLLTLTSMLVGATIVYSTTACAQDGLAEPAPPDQLADALRQLNALQDPDGPATPEPQDATVFEAPESLSNLAAPGNIETANPPPPFPEAPEIPTEPASDQTTVPPTSIPDADIVPSQTESLADAQPPPSTSPAEPVIPEPGPDSPSPLVSPEPAPDGFEPGASTGLPLVTDPRVQIANDQVLISLAASLIESLSDVHDSGHGPAMISLLRASRPEDTEMHGRFATLLSLIGDARDESAAALAQEMYLRQIAEAQAAAPDAQTDNTPAAAPPPAPPPSAPAPAPEPRQEFDIIPVTAQVETEWGQTEKAIISINRTRHILWPGDTIDDPNGEPITLLRVEAEGPENNPVNRIVIDHNGRTRRLAWTWE